MKRVIVFLTIISILLGSFGIYLCKNYELPILMYHSIDSEKVNTYAAVSKDVFYKQMKFIKDKGYQVISLANYCKILKNNESIPKKSLIITFDDGYADNLKAVEILKEFNFSATFFLIVNKIGEPGYLSYEDVGKLLKDSRLTIGTHTLNEVYLPEASNEELKDEITLAKLRLGELFNQDIETTSYTIGGFDARTIKEVKSAGYLCACTTNRGFSKWIDRYALRRIKITNRDKDFKLWAKLSGLYNVFRRLRNPH